MGLSGPRQRGAQFDYSNQAIEAVLTLKEVFHLTNREAEGLVRSVFALMQVALAVPDHSTLLRRGRTVQIQLPKRARGPLHVVIDSSGLKVFGEGEWKVRQHGWSKRRTWRKMHLSIDATSGEVQAAMLSTADVSDAEMVEPMLAQIDAPLASVAADGAMISGRSMPACRCARLTPRSRFRRVTMHGSGNMATRTRRRIRAMKRCGSFGHMVGATMEGRVGLSSTFVGRNGSLSLQNYLR